MDTLATANFHHNLARYVDNPRYQVTKMKPRPFHISPDRAMIYRQLRYDMKTIDDASQQNLRTPGMLHLAKSPRLALCLSILSPLHILSRRLSRRRFPLKAGSILASRYSFYLHITVDTNDIRILRVLISAARKYDQRSKKRAVRVRCKSLCGDYGAW